jgi:hypothetical protein
LRCSYLDKASHATDRGLHTLLLSRGQDASEHSTRSATPDWGYRSRGEPPFDSYSVNMLHLRLFANIQSTDFLVEGLGTEPEMIPTRVYLNHAATTPYLMHQVLSISALHLSIIQPSQSRFYRAQSTGLQTRALHLFKESYPVLQLTTENSTTMFLFTTMLGVSLLGEALQHHRSSLDDFLGRFATCLDVYRGIKTVSVEGWHLLSQTEVSTHLMWSRSVMSEIRGGAESERWSNLFEDTDMSMEAQSACLKAATKLDRLLDLQIAEHTNTLGRKCFAMFVWPADLNPTFVELLRQAQPEALVILAHYAIFLMQSSELWLIGDAGKWLVQSIAKVLNPAMLRHIDAPLQVLERSFR